MNRSTARQLMLIGSVIAGAIHLGLSGLFISNGEFGTLTVLFVLNGIAFFVLLAAVLSNRVPVLSQQKTLSHWLLITLAAATIIAWVPGGSRDALGYASIIAELLVIVGTFFHIRR